MDICQSVLASFFDRVAHGGFELDSPQQLGELLATMARNKLIKRYHHERSRRRWQTQAIDLDRIQDAAGGPIDESADRDLVEDCLARLTLQERRIASQRAAGQSWAQIAGELQTSAEALRKQFTRACHCVVEQLNPAE
jgi:RNA polymerase sigma factor (sigma-70 family)